MRPFSILLLQFVVVGAAVPMQMSFEVSKWIRHFHAYKCVWYCVLAAQHTLCWLAAYVYSLEETASKETKCATHFKNPYYRIRIIRKFLLGFSPRNLAKMYPEFSPYLFTRLLLETSSFCLPLSFRFQTSH